MCFIYEGGKKASPGSSEEQVAQAVKNSAEIVIAHEEDDERAAIGNDVEFEIPQAVMELITEMKSIIIIGVTLTKPVLHPTTCRVDMERDTNFVNIY